MHVMLSSFAIFSRVSSSHHVPPQHQATTTKRRHVDGTPAAPQKSDWLSVFAAVSMLIGEDVMEGSLFPMTAIGIPKCISPYWRNHQGHSHSHTHSAQSSRETSIHRQGFWSHHLP